MSEGDVNLGVVGVDEGTLIMYDDKTRSQWSQLFGIAVEGEMKGTSLDKVPSTMTTWGEWRKLHPDTTVYVKPTAGYSRRFTRESFANIARLDPGPVREDDVIVGLEGHVLARAYLLRRLAGDRLVQERFEGASIVVYLSDDLTTTKVWLAKVDDRELSFERAGEELEDRETGSRWDPLRGQATSGELKGRELQPLVSTYAVWFAWKHYRPDTTVHGEE